MREWTKEQLQAISVDGCNILVAAAAGSGKTAVLVERIIQKVTEKNVDIDRLLIVTFTNSAASEMRERIYLGMNKKLDGCESGKNILRQMTLLDKASITTMHSFCLEVIRNNLCAIDLDPSFRIADETETILLKNEVLNDLFEEEYESQNLRLLNLLDSYGGNKDDKVIQDMVLDLYHFIQSDPWPTRWLHDMIDNIKKASNDDFSCTPWGQIILDNIYQNLNCACANIVAAMDVMATDKTLKDKYYPIFNEDYVKISSIIDVVRNKDDKLRWDKLYNLLNDLEFKRLPAINKSLEVDEDKKDKVKELRDDVKDIVKKIREKKITSMSKDIGEDIGRVCPNVECLVELVEKFTDLYEQKKKKKNIVDFGDLEHYCLQILTTINQDGSVEASGVAKMYKDKFEEILVDEYQDSNDIQEKIISMISREDLGYPNVFMVGDVKQSIYRFRQANPSLFLDKYNNYSKDENSEYRKIQLFKNFRSRRGIIDIANFIFEQVMSSYVGDLDYTEDEALNFAASFPHNDGAIGDEAELHLINIEDYVNDEEEDEEESLNAIQCEARVVAKRILDLIEQKDKNMVYDKNLGCYRPIEYKDIVILLRTTKNWADIFVRELHEVGISAFADINTGFFKTIEIMVVTSFLQIIDNPLQDIPLLAVLRSPIVGLNANELAQIRVVDKEVLMFDAIEKFLSMEHDDESKLIKQKLEYFMHLYNELKEQAWYMSIDELIWNLYDKTGYYVMVGAMPMGEQKQANLRMLFEKARQFEETSYKGLFNFINFIDKLRNSSSDFGSAKILGENDNVVRIMSIHKSKGLEFPIVFLSGCGKKVNLMDTTKNVIFHSKLGFGPDVVDIKRRISWASALKIAIGEKIKQETLSEEMRILYVAVTRAREKLIITGSVRDLDKKLNKWRDVANAYRDKISSYDVYRGRTFLDWMCPVVLKHKNSSDFFEDVPVGFEFPTNCVDDESCFRVFLVNKSDIKDEVKKVQQDNELFEQALYDIEVSDEITFIPPDILQSLNWEYQYKGLESIPAKVSVTQLKKNFASDDEVVVNKPKFLEQQNKLEATSIGTALHFVMQHINFCNQDINGQIESMVTRGLLTKDEASSVDTRKIKRFIESKLGQRIKASNKINREEPFFLKIPCSEVFDVSDSEDEYVVLQGVIDCYFEEEGYLVLLDYKTDFVRDKSDICRIKERYKTQIMKYKEVLEKLTGKEVRYQYIYLFSNDSVIKY
ncbi:MAG: helicase-exonuclease AddAB subunit AddA [Clostridiales bacterium]|nr:helicase-exonuclease AddAB subunit AddA [Clostridiales bacterium]